MQSSESLLGGLMNLNRLVELENAFDNQKMRDEVMVSLEMNLPIYRRRIRAGIREARHRENSARHEKHRRTLELHAAAQMAVFGMEDARRRLNLLDSTLLPQAQQTYEALLASYASGSMEADVLDLLSSVQMLLDFELEKAQVKRDLQVAAAELEMLMGGPWASEAEQRVPAEGASGDKPAESPEPDATVGQ
jgi:outer membrane protein TolC